MQRQLCPVVELKIDTHRGGGEPKYIQIYIRAGAYIHIYIHINIYIPADAAPTLSG